MKKKTAVIALLILASLACNIAISDFFGESSDYDEFASEVEFSGNLTATLFALETLIVEATADASSTQTATAAEQGQIDSGSFCGVYAEFVNDLNRRVDEYSAAVAVDGDAHSIAVEADEAIEVYMDRLAPVAPEEIRAEVETLANMSLIGLLSSPDQKPEAEPFLAVVDNYATDNCEISLSE